MSGHVLAIMDDICEWLRNNNITPGDVPINEVPVVLTDGHIECDVFLRDNDGRLIVDRYTGEPAMGHIRVPMLAEPAEVLYDWLRGAYSS